MNPVRDRSETRVKQGVVLMVLAMVGAAAILELPPLLVALLAATLVLGWLPLAAAAARERIRRGAACGECGARDPAPLAFCVRCGADRRDFPGSRWEAGV